MKPNDFPDIITKIRGLLCQKEFVVIAIDGRCASGKTTLADAIKQEFSCNVLHMDDFYLPLEQRDADWQETPGKNINFQSVKEILNHISLKEDYRFRPYQCASASYGEPIHYQKNRLTVLEGTYSCHPQLQEYFDYRIFATISPEEQAKRIIERNGREGYLRFQSLWIPLEESYFSKYLIKNNCHLVLSEKKD